MIWEVSIIRSLPYQASVIVACYCHHPAVLGSLLMASPFYTDVDDIFEITECMPLQPKKEEFMGGENDHLVLVNVNLDMVCRAK